MGNEQLVIEIPGINTKSGLDLCDGDLNIYLHSLRLYLSNMPVTLDKLRDVSVETLGNYAVSVHGAKGISEYIGAEDAKKMAKQLESMAKNGDLAGVLSQNEAFIKHSEGLIDSIRNWLKQNSC